MSDDAIPNMAEAASAEGVGTEHVSYKEKITHEIETSASHIDEIKKHTSGANSIRNRASFFHKAAEDASPKVSSVFSPTKNGSAKKEKLAARFAQATQDPCRSCGKAVYHAEKIIASGHLFHKTCFKCGLGDAKGCGKALSIQDHEEYDRVMYCRNCARKQHNEHLSKASGYSEVLKPKHVGEVQRRGSMGTQQGKSMTSDSSSFSMEEMAAAATADAEAEALVEAETGATTETEKEEEEQESFTEAPVEAEALAEAPIDAPTEASTEAPTEASTEAPTEAATEDAAEETAVPSEDPSTMVTPKKAVPGTKEFFECPFTFPFDQNGVIYWIGSEGKQVKYVNPQLTGQLYVEISTLYRGKLDNITSYTEPTNSAERIAAATYTNNSAKSWIIIDFGPERSLRPSYYCLKHGASGIGNAIRNWTLEAKTDEYSPYVTLRTHSNDTTMREEPQSKAAYELNNEICKSNFYRIFRLTQTGKNSGGNDCLFVGGIDFYGVMKVETLGAEEYENTA